MLLGLRGLGGAASVVLLLGTLACGEDPALGAGGEGDGGSSETGDGSTGEPASIGEQIEAFIAMKCERASACDCAGLVGSSDCAEAENAAWEARLEAGEARGLTRDDACVATNLATLETAACAWPSAVLEGEHLCTQYCAIYHGDRGMGESCEAYDALVSDCAQGLLCDGGTCIDPCVRLTGLPLGEVCGTEMSGPYEDCASGAYCDWQTRACTALAQAGESCDDRECADGLHCDWNTFTCFAGGDVGDSCGDTGYCQDDLWCDYASATPTCRARSIAGQSCSSVPCADDLVCGEGSICAEPPPAGQPCLSGQCEDGALCDWDVNVCIAPPSVGQECPLGQCESGAWCDNATVPEGVCNSLVVEGEACTGHAQCESGYCPRGYCEARPGEGEDCSVLFICARGLVCNGTMCQPTSYRGPAACVYPAW